MRAVPIPIRIVLCDEFKRSKMKQAKFEKEIVSERHKFVVGICYNECFLSVLLFKQEGDEK